MIVILTIVGFWYVGKKDKEKKTVDQQKIYADIIRRDQELKLLVAKSIANASTSQLESLAQESLPKSLNIKNLKISADNSSSTLKEYGLTIASILKPYEKVRENEAEITLKALENQSQISLQKLSTIKGLYETTSAEMLKIKVPKGLADYHIEIINSLKNMAVLLDNMRMVLDKPLVGLQSAELYTKELSAFYASINKISDQLKQAGIKFETGEGINIYMNT